MSIFAKGESKNCRWDYASELCGLDKRFHLSSANLSVKRVNGWEINAVGQKENGKMLPMLRLVHAMVYKMRAGPG